jgi:hypothetical protein
MRQGIADSAGSWNEAKARDGSPGNLGDPAHVHARANRQLGRRLNNAPTPTGREICTSGTVRDEGGNILIYPAGSAIRSLIPRHCMTAASLSLVLLPIENTQGTIRCVMRDVKRWRDISMALG